MERSWKKSRWPRSAYQVMATAFRDHKDVLLVHFMEQGTTTNDTSYSDILRWSQIAIKHICCELLTGGYCFYAIMQGPTWPLQCKNCWSASSGQSWNLWLITMIWHTVILTSLLYWMFIFLAKSFQVMTMSKQYLPGGWNHRTQFSTFLGTDKLSPWMNQGGDK